ncbi:hypothetical protein VTN77DRAFT_794 [Rasamsonia byssochlamydoides]|uniref:uncharacterized protein n=1 Tax=Rasamsonia byssochlamydoides TaxID=89139 RepID=UPI0037443510
MEEVIADGKNESQKPQPQPQAQTQTEPSSKRKKIDDDAGRGSSNVIHFTARNPLWTYLKLQLILQPGSSTITTLDAVTARTYLTSALSQFLGLTGTAISIDILKIETVRTAAAANTFLWIRVPREDAAAVVAALSSWIGGSRTSSGGSSSSSSGADVAWRVCAKGNFLAAVVHGSGRELFQP